MTKVFIDAFGIAYRKQIAETVCEIIMGRHIAGVTARGCPEPPLSQVNLMPPPMIEIIDLTIYEGNVNDLILLAASDLFGIWNVHLTISDDQGNIVESGDAVEEPVGSGIWKYFANIAIPSSTSVIVHAAATDSLGGVGTLRTGRTIP